MTKIILNLLLVSILGLLATTPSLADDCIDAGKSVEMVVASPPVANTDKVLQEALEQCPNDPKIYQAIGGYFDHWSRHDINPEKQAYYNYLATEYYAKGIKVSQGDEKKEMQLKLAALESGTEDITPVGIRSIKPYARLNIKVLFEFNSSELTAGGQEQLDVLGQYLAEGNSSRIILEGHTDMAGDEEYNMMLSVQRAESAKQYLVQEFNLSPEIIEIHGYGFERLADVIDPYGPKNRRVRVRKLPLN